MSTLKIDYMEMILPGICSIVHIYTKVLKSMQCNSICLVLEILIKSQKNRRTAHESLTEVNFFSESIILRFEF